MITNHTGIEYEMASKYFAAMIPILSINSGFYTEIFYPLENTLVDSIYGSKDNIIAHSTKPDNGRNLLFFGGIFQGNNYISDFTGDHYNEDVTWLLLSPKEEELILETKLKVYYKNKVLFYRISKIQDSDSNNFPMFKKALLTPIESIV